MSSSFPRKFLRSRIVCCWHARPDSLVHTHITQLAWERGRGSRKENENKPYPHPVKPYHFLTSSARSQIPAGMARVNSSEVLWDVGTGRDRDYREGCPAASSAAQVIKVLRSVWRDSGIGVRDSRLTARSS